MTDINNRDNDPDASPHPTSPAGAAGLPPLLGRDATYLEIILSIFFASAHDDWDPAGLRSSGGWDDSWERCKFHTEPPFRVCEHLRRALACIQELNDTGPEHGFFLARA